MGMTWEDSAQSEHRCLVMEHHILQAFDAENLLTELIQLPKLFNVCREFRVQNVLRG